MGEVGFSEEKMRQKLAKLTNHPQVIGNTATWIINYAKHHTEEIMQIWLKALKHETNTSRLVLLLYLANDIVQQSRKLRPELTTRFLPTLEHGFRHCAKIPGPEVAKTVNRIIEVLGDRNMYDADQCAKLRQAAAGKPKSLTTDFFGQEKPATKEVVYDSEAITACCSDTVHYLQKLASAPSENPELREQLNDCPEVISKPELLETIRSEEEVKSLLEQINVVEPLVGDFCRRLDQEMDDRRALQKHMEDLMLHFRASVDHQEKLCKEIKRREERMKHDLKEITRAYESLPDLDNMEMAAPLPSAELLFK